MKSTLHWNENMAFKVKVDSHELLIDAKTPIGKDSAPTPKDLVGIGLGGCTAMDVIALMKKHKQPVESLDVEVDITPSEGTQPVVFTKATITFKAKGQIDKDKLLEAVHLSQTKYCGVSAMLSKAFPIHYIVELNDTQIGTGQATFS